jgi:hypothetical protein
MKTPQNLALGLITLALAGCVGMDMGSDPGGSRGTPGQLSKEQKWHLRSAAGAGEHELSATAARLAWDEPDDRRAIVDYAVELLPESEQAVTSAVYSTRR